MALNRVREHANQVSVPVPSGTESGDPVLIGDSLPGVALVDRGAQTENEATCQFDGSYRLSVAGTGDVGDLVYIDASDGTLTTASGGDHVRFGYLLEAKGGSGAADVEVKIGY